MYCIQASACCTPQLREELSQISFQTLHSVSDTFEFGNTRAFWYFSEEIIKMLEKQVSRDYLNSGESVTN